MVLFWLIASMWLGLPKRNHLPLLLATCIQDLTLVSVSVDGKDLDKAHYEVTEKELTIKGDALPAGKPYSLKVGFGGIQGSGFRGLQGQGLSPLYGNGEGVDHQGRSSASNSLKVGFWGCQGLWVWRVQACV